MSLKVMYFRSLRQIVLQIGPKIRSAREIIKTKGGRDLTRTSLLIELLPKRAIKRGILLRVQWPEEIGVWVEVMSHNNEELLPMNVIDADL